MKGLLLFSAGLDAVTLLDMHRKDIEVCLYVKTSSRATLVELDLASRVCKEYSKELIVIDSNDAFQTFKTQSSKSKIRRVEKPMRNGVLITLAAGLADSMGLDTVFVGAHKGDEVFCPDGSRSFIEAIGRSIYEGTNRRVRLSAPFLSSTKKEIGEHYIRLDIPSVYSYSCFEGRERHCGICSGCIERKIVLGTSDETIYEDSKMFSKAPTSLAPSKIVKMCKDILEQRQNSYGAFNSTSISKLTSKLYNSISVVSKLDNKEDARSAFLRSMLTTKSLRAFAQPDNIDHYIDFINYASMAKSSGYDVTLDSKVFNFSDCTKDYIDDKIDLDLFVESIWSRGFFVESFKL